MAKESKVVESFDRELDISNAGRGIWLVKVPKYISRNWEKASSRSQIGKLRIVKAPGEKAELSLTISDSVNLDDKSKIPKYHKLDISAVTKQTLGVYSHEPLRRDGNEYDKLVMEGRIVQKFDCKPVLDESYMKMKSESLEKATSLKKRTERLDKVVQNFKPVSDHKYNIEYKERKKLEGKKMRDDKNSVLEKLFNAFEKHQYYNIKDLVRITNQPVGYLKEIIKEYCDYNVKNPHKNMWELKKEYRHYKTDTKTDE